MPVGVAPACFQTPSVQCYPSLMKKKKKMKKTTPARHVGYAELTVEGDGCEKTDTQPRLQPVKVAQKGSTLPYTASRNSSP